jgi:hypothetical protein
MDTILGILPGESYSGIHTLVDLSMCFLIIPTVCLPTSIMSATYNAAGFLVIALRTILMGFQIKRVLWALNMLPWHCIDEERDDKSFMRVERVSCYFQNICVLKTKT